MHCKEKDVDPNVANSYTQAWQSHFLFACSTTYNLFSYESHLRPSNNLEKKRNDPPRLSQHFTPKRDFFFFSASKGSRK